jgi:hypothetical protein
MAKKRRQKPQHDMPVYYVVQISRWDWSYSFSLNATRYRQGPYLEFRHLHIWGTLLLPSNLKPDTVELTLMPDILLGADAWQPPRAVGSLELHGADLIGHLSMMSDALGPVLQMLIANVTKFVVMDGERMRYRKSLLRGYSLDSHFEPED